MNDRFADRIEAGRLLAKEMTRYAGRPDVIVLGLPRGGVPVASQVARALDAPLDVFVVRKLGVPGHRELAMGAIATGGVRVLNDEAITGLGISPRVIDEVTAVETREMLRREMAYRGHSGAPRVRRMTVILVDDGMATGSTMRAAVRALQQLDAGRIVVAVPVASRSSLDEITQEADEAVALLVPDEFVAVGEWYENFAQVPDDEVKRLLDLHQQYEERRAVL